jgi:RecB family endonuclease NucS
MKEKDLQDFLTENKGKRLRNLDSDLLYLEQEYTFPGGRVDILALKQGLPVGIELKAKKYNTNAVCGQLHKYLSFFKEKKGSVYFVAPYIAKGVQETFKNESAIRLYSFDKHLRFYEHTISGNYRLPVISSRSFWNTYIAAPVSTFVARKLFNL